MILIYPPALSAHSFTLVYFIWVYRMHMKSWMTHVNIEIIWHVFFYIMLERSVQMQFLRCHHDCLSNQHHTVHADAESCYFRLTLYLVVSGKHWAYSAARIQAVCASHPFAACLLSWHCLNYNSPNLIILLNNIISFCLVSSLVSVV